MPSLSARGIFIQSSSYSNDEFYFGALNLRPFLYEHPSFNPNNCVLECTFWRFNAEFREALYLAFDDSVSRPMPLYFWGESFHFQGHSYQQSEPFDDANLRLKKMGLVPNLLEKSGVLTHISGVLKAPERRRARGGRITDAEWGMYQRNLLRGARDRVNWP